MCKCGIDLSSSKSEHYAVEIKSLIVDSHAVLWVCAPVDSSGIRFFFNHVLIFITFFIWKSIYFSFEVNVNVY